jgi:hypothetical protein
MPGATLLEAPLWGGEGDMALPLEQPFDLQVESFLPTSTAGRHGTVHVRPVDGQGVSTALNVECPAAMKTDYPVGTRFLVKVRYSNRKGGPTFLKAPYAWEFSVLAEPAGKSPPKSKK